MKIRSLFTKTRFTKTFFLFALSVGLSACDKQIEKFVEGVVPKQAEMPQSSSPVGIKFSPGRLEATSADISAEATVTPTRHIMTSGDVSARMGVGRTRVTQ